MAVRIRTTKRIARGVSVVSYQSPKQYFIGLFLGFSILFSIIHTIFGSWTQWVIAAAVLVMWFSAIVSGGMLSKLLWSFGLLFTSYMIWTSNGCIGNRGFCDQIQADAEADRKASAIQKAQSEMEICSEQLDWRGNPDCRIYSEQEIAVARARVTAKRNAEARDERALEDKERQDRLNEAIRNRDAFRAATGPSK